MKFLFPIFLVLLAFNAHALTFELPRHGDIVGAVQKVRVHAGDTLQSIGERFDVGTYEMIEANPRIHPYHPSVGSFVTLPTAYILPKAPREGLVINLAEMRLYFYPKNQRSVITFPVGIGRMGWETPEGKTIIIHKTKDPTWRPPESIRRWAKSRGFDLPDVVAPGPRNPLGQYAFRLGFSGYLMHGTNDTTGVGRRCSAGCIRLYPKDIEKLFSLLPVGTPVRIINQPYKLGQFHGQWWMEAHEPLASQSATHLENRTELVKILLHHKQRIHWNTFEQAIDEKKGIPVQLSHSH